MFEGPAACFDGLVDELGQGQVEMLAVVAASAEELDRATGRMEGAPLLTGRFGDRCNH